MVGQKDIIIHILYPSSMLVENAIVWQRFHIDDTTVCLFVCFYFRHKTYIQMKEIITYKEHDTCIQWNLTYKTTEIITLSLTYGGKWT